MLFLQGRDKMQSRKLISDGWSEDLKANWTYWEIVRNLPRYDKIDLLV